MFCPRGARRANWSNVKHSPPAFSILALAVSVNLSAVTLRQGISCTLTSSVTVPTITAILSSWSNKINHHNQHHVRDIQTDQNLPSTHVYIIIIKHYIHPSVSLSWSKSIYIQCNHSVGQNSCTFCSWQDSFSISMNMRFKLFNRKKDIIWEAIREIDANRNIVNTKFTKHNL